MLTATARAQHHFNRRWMIFDHPVFPLKRLYLDAALGHCPVIPSRYHSFNDPVENVAVLGGAVQLMLDLLPPHINEGADFVIRPSRPAICHFLYLMPRMTWGQPL